MSDEPESYFAGNTDPNKRGRGSISTVITITDKVGDGATVTLDDAWNVVEAIRAWYPGAPAEVLIAVYDLQAALIRRDDQRVYELGTYLGIEITH